MSFPLEVGQVPIYYNHLNTGRPAKNDSSANYRSAYIDLSIYPKYEFGYGLSYTTFAYSNLRLSAKLMKPGGNIRVEITVSNTGTADGEEVVQLYLRDLVASVFRPVMELKDFKKIKLKAGEKKTIQFVIDKNKLSFYNQQLDWRAEPGKFDLMIGASSRDIRARESFELLK